MISFEEALQLILGNSLPKTAEKVELGNALNRILAQDVISDTNIPPFNKSAMDGFACRRSDIANTLTVIEEIPAGYAPVKTINSNECARIMTGGMVPEGADFVLQLEHATEVETGKIKCIKEISGSNICNIGEDILQGDIVLAEGEIILPQHIAILASAGVTYPMVYALPKIGIISTGNELVEPGEIPGISQIRNSNGYQLVAQTSQNGYKPEYLGIARDNEDELSTLLTNVIDKYNIVLLSGGVSVGDYDFVPKVLKKLGVEIIFHGIDAKPGKHLLFGRKENCMVFGLPGNPVSSFIQFEVLIKPLLIRLKGEKSLPVVQQFSMSENYFRKKADTISFIPAQYLENNTVLPLEYHGSAHIHSYGKANGIIEIPKGITEYKKGDLVNVRPL